MYINKIVTRIHIARVSVFQFQLQYLCAHLVLLHCPTRFKDVGVFRKHISEDRHGDLHEDAGDWYILHTTPLSSSPMFIYVFVTRPEDNK